MKLIFKKIFKKEYLLLYLILIIGAFVRLEGVFTKSFAFTYDVGRDMLALWNMVYNHKISLIGATTGIPGVFYGPWWYYMLTPFFLLFKGNPQGIAFVMSLIGITTIMLSYYLGKKLDGAFLALVLAGLISSSSVMISLSSQIWNPNIAPFFVILILLFLNKIYSNARSYKYYFLLGLFLALAIDIEIVFGLFFSIGIIISLILIKKKKISLKEILLFVIGSFLIISPRILFELRHQFIMSKSFVSYLAKGDSAYMETTFMQTVANRAMVFFNQFSNVLSSGNKIFGAIFLALIILTLILFYKKTKEVVKNYIKTILITIVVFFTGTLFFKHDIWDHYLVGLPVLYILLFSIALITIHKKVTKYKIIIPIIAILIFLFNINPISIYQGFKKPLWEGDASVYRNQLSVIDYVYDQAKGKEFKYVTYTPPVYDYTYQYLFTWYGLTKYHYMPSTQSDLAFFILEPDLQYPERLSNWLELRREDGNIVSSKEVKGGIVVQKRLIKANEKN